MSAEEIIRLTGWLSKAERHATMAEASAKKLGWGEDEEHVRVFVDRNVAMSLMYSNLVLAHKHV